MEIYYARPTIDEDHGFTILNEVISVSVYRDPRRSSRLEASSPRIDKLFSWRERIALEVVLSMTLESATHPTTMANAAGRISASAAGSPVLLFSELN
jgi:hypothetical protein